MKPQLGDTLFNRYTLVTLLRDEPGVQAWRANDRVLAHDCQLFVLTDPGTLEDVSSLATQLGRKSGITPVLQFRRSGDAAVLVTRVESGLSLTEYLNGPARGTISFEAMRSIIAETATIATALEQPRLSTDTIRISVQGIEIADAPLAGLLVEPTKAPKTIQGEQLAIRQLASVLYAMLTRRPTSLNTTYDLASIGDIPGEFHVILSRGLELTKEDGRRSEPMLTLSELTALLGECKPLTDLTDQDIALPSDAGAGSIATVHVRDMRNEHLTSLPHHVVTTEKLPDLTIHRPLTEAEAARHAEQVVAEQNKQTFAEMQAAFDNYSPRVLGDQPGRLPTDAKGKPMRMPALPERPASDDSGYQNYQGYQGYQGDDLFHEFSFQTQALPTMPSGANPGEETTRIPVFVDPNMATEAIDVSSVRHEMKAKSAAPAAGAAGAASGAAGGAGAPVAGAGAAGAPVAGGAGAGAPAAAGTSGVAGTSGASGANGTIGTIGTQAGNGVAGANAGAVPPSIPVPDADATIVDMAPIGHDGAAGTPVAFAPAPHARGVAMPDALMQQPPSFTPKESPVQADAAQGDGDNLAKQRLFGKMTTTVVVVIVASVLIVAALVFAVLTFMHSNTNPADSGVDKNNQWPSQKNLENVPFGDTSNNETSNDSNGASTNGSAESDIEYINVTAAYHR